MSRIVKPSSNQYSLNLNGEQARALDLMMKETGKGLTQLIVEMLGLPPSWQRGKHYIKPDTCNQ